MTYWMWVLGYIFGGLAAFRVVYLRYLNEAEREHAACTKSNHRWYNTGKCDRREVHFDDVLFISILIAVFWPLVLVSTLVWKIMFPRGVVTKYSRQLELERKQQAKQKELDRLAHDIKKASKAAGLKIPEGL